MKLSAKGRCCHRNAGRTSEIVVNGESGITLCLDGSEMLHG